MLLQTHSALVIFQSIHSPPPFFFFSSAVVQMAQAHHLYFWQHTATPTLAKEAEEEQEEEESRGEPCSEEWSLGKRISVDTELVKDMLQACRRWDQIRMSRGKEIHSVILRWQTRKRKEERLIIYITTNKLPAMISTSFSVSFLSQQIVFPCRGFRATAHK